MFKLPFFEELEGSGRILLGGLTRDPCSRSFGAIQWYWGIKYI